MPEAKRNFPLIVWEGTEEFKREYEEAKKRFQDIAKRLYARGFTCTFLGDLRLDNNCNPEVWLNDNRNIYKYDWKTEEAIEHAKIHGNCRWWSLDYLYQFVNGDGPIFEEAMWRLGFRRHKINPEKWARLEGELKRYTSPLSDKLWQERNGKTYTEISGQEAERLSNLLIMPNESAGIGRTYTISANKRGMIYIELWANPFVGTTAETMYLLGEQMSQRGHIAKQQQGFEIESTNVRLNVKGDFVIPEKAVEVVYSKLIKPDKTVRECLLPSTIPQDKLYDLADNLVARVNS